MNMDSRRPIKARSLGVMQKLAKTLASSSITPNQISTMSALVSCLVPAALLHFGANFTGCLIAALGIQLRLLCNLIDGMVAVEGGKKSILGDIYNEFPDRISDTIILLGFGLPVWGEPHVSSLAWAAALLALLTAYTRVLGATLGTKHYFSGPMAKQHRMALITVALLLLPFVSILGASPLTLIRGTLLVICFGCALTVCRRLLKIATELKGR